MSKKLLFELAAIAVIIGGIVFFYYSFCKAMKQIAPQKTTTLPTDSLPAKEKTDTTIVLSGEGETYDIIAADGTRHQYTIVHAENCKYCRESTNKKHNEIQQ